MPDYTNPEDVKRIEDMISPEEKEKMRQWLIAIETQKRNIDVATRMGIDTKGMKEELQANQDKLERMLREL